MSSLATPAPHTVENISLRSRVVSAAGWRLCVYAWLQIIRLASNVVLAKLLAPQIFGVVAIGLSVMQGLRMFSELGIGQAIVQSKLGADPTMLRTAWTLQILRGIAIGALACLLAWPLSVSFGEPSLFGVFVILGISAAVSGFNSTAIFTKNRELKEVGRGALDVLQQLVVRGTMIAWACFWPSPFALAGGSLAGALVYMAGSHFLLGKRQDRLGWSWEIVRQMAHFGGWIFVGTVIAYFAQQADKLLLGVVGGVIALGTYTVALTVSRIPFELFSSVVAVVLFPALADRARRGSDDLIRGFRLARGAMMPVAFSTCLTVVLASPWFFRLMYDDRYADAVWIAPLATGATWFAILEMIGNRAMLAIGKAKPLAFGSLADVLCTVVFTLIGFYAVGVWGFVLGSILGAAAGYLYLQRILSKQALATFGADMRWTVALLLVGTITIMTSETISHWFQRPWNFIAPIGLSGTVVAACGLWAFGRFRTCLRGTSPPTDRRSGESLRSDNSTTVSMD